jgi:hypothetical protein
MSKHNAVRFLRVSDGKEVTSDEAFSKDGILKSGFSISTPMTAMDAMQKDIAKDGLTSMVKYTGPGKLSHTVTAEDPDDDEDEVDDAVPTALSDGMAVADHRPGFRTAPPATADSIEHAERGTRDAMLQDDYLAHDQAEATRYKDAHGEQNADQGSPPQTASVADARDQAYADYDKEMSEAYRRG